MWTIGEPGQCEVFPNRTMPKTIVTSSMFAGEDVHALGEAKGQKGPVSASNIIDLALDFPAQSCPRIWHGGYTADSAC